MPKKKLIATYLTSQVTTQLTLIKVVGKKTFND